MFIVDRLQIDPLKRDFSFVSVYQEEKPLLSSGFQKTLLSESYFISQPIRGLVCLQRYRELKIYNPGMNKYSRPLPKIREPRNTTAISTLFGYDDNTHVYKVLCIIDQVLAKERLFFTMGLNENAWRQITCEHVHCTVATGVPGLCTGGVLYYRALRYRVLSPSQKPLLMSFNVSSEEFTAIQLPEGVQNFRGWDLVNFKGKIALVNDANFTFGVSRNSIYVFRGTTKKGILVFSIKNSLPTIDGKKSLFVVYYNQNSGNLRKFMIEGVDEGNKVATYLDHIDSPLLLEDLVH